MSNPVGTIIAFAGDYEKNKESLIDQGWLLCNGDSLTKDDYRTLSEVIGSLYGEPDSGKDFKLPDYRGFFLRGKGGKPPHISEEIGVVQKDKIKKHRHKTTTYTDADYYKINYKEILSSFIPKRSTTAINSDEGNPAEIMGEETIPINMSVNYLIRFRADTI